MLLTPRTWNQASRPGTNEPARNLPNSKGEI